MALFGCNCRRNCILTAVVVSLIIGIVAAFLQIAAVITVTPAFALGALVIAVGAFGVLLLSVALTCRAERRPCLCGVLEAVLTGILGTALFAVVLLAVGITATSVVSAILIGLLAAFLTLTFTGTACLVRCLADCED